MCFCFHPAKRKGQPDPVASRITLGRTFKHQEQHPMQRAHLWMLAISVSYQRCMPGMLGMLVCTVNHTDVASTRGGLILMEDAYVKHISTNMNKIATDDARSEGKRFCMGENSKGVILLGWSKKASLEVSLRGRPPEQEPPLEHFGEQHTW